MGINQRSGYDKGIDSTFCTKAPKKDKNKKGKKTGLEGDGG